MCAMRIRCIVSNFEFLVLDEFGTTPKNTNFVQHQKFKFFKNSSYSSKKNKKIKRIDKNVETISINNEDDIKKINTND